MSNRIQTISFTSDSIAAGGSLQINRNVGPNWINILKVKVTPSTSTSPLRMEFYSRNTFLAADRIGGYSISTAGPIIDPMEDVGAGPVDRGQRGFIMPYDDLDNNGQIHFVIYNDHTVAQTYTIVIDWEPRFFLSPGATLSMSPGNVGHDIQNLDVNDNTSTQKVEIYREGAAVGSARKRVNFVAGNSNIVVSAADTGSQINVTLYGAGAANIRRTKWFDSVDIISGGAYNTTHDNQSVVGFPKSANSEIGFGFRIDDDFVATGDLSLVVVGASLASPGTNMELSLKSRWKANNGALSAYTTDSFALSNNTQWRRDEASNNKVAGGVGNYAANDHVEFRVLRDTSYASAGSAQAEYGVQRFGIEYTSSQ